MTQCECERKYGIPSGLLCGNPDCLRTKRAEESMKRAFEKAFPKEEKSAHPIKPYWSDWTGIGDFE